MLVHGPYWLPHKSITEIKLHNIYFWTLRLRWIRMFWNHSQWASTDSLWHYFTPSLIESWKFHKERILSITSNSEEPKSTISVQSQDKWVGSRSQPQSVNQGIHFHSSQLPNLISLDAMPWRKLLTNLLMFCIIFTTSL